MARKKSASYSLTVRKVAEELTAHAELAKPGAFHDWGKQSSGPLGPPRNSSLSSVIMDLSEVERS